MLNFVTPSNVTRAVQNGQMSDNIILLGKSYSQERSICQESSNSNNVSSLVNNNNVNTMECDDINSSLGEPSPKVSRCSLGLLVDYSGSDSD